MENHKGEIHQQFQTSCNIQQTEDHNLQKGHQYYSAQQGVPTTQQPVTEQHVDDEDSDDDIETDGIPEFMTQLRKKVGEFVLPSENDIMSCYPKRDRGVFLLIANFTNDLKGYMQDRAELKKFFEVDLEYTCLEYFNCTQKEMLGALEDTKNKIKDLKCQGHNPNRLVVAILTHGGVNGIHTCKDNDGFFKETEADNRTQKVTELETIFDKFKHDANNLPELKGLPKFFIIQACHGEETVKAAGGSSPRRTDSVPEPHRNPKLPDLPVDSDLLVLSAATKYNKAFVSDRKGSWLIQHMLEVFRKNHKSTDLEMMLKEVSLRVSGQKQAVTNADGTQEMARQLPSRQSTLLKTCLL